MSPTRFTATQALKKSPAFRQFAFKVRPKTVLMDRDAAVAQAQQKLAARSIRLRRVRNGSIAGGVAAFVIAWGVIFGQLTSGHDPALAQSSSTSTTTTDADDSMNSGSLTGSSSDDSTQVESETTPMTTQQS